MNIRIGHGFDVHKFGGDSPLVLGGVTVPYDSGLIAHSDGDVVLHAISDAILGAMALGDIGKHFPDTDANFAGADSRVLLKHCYQLALQKQFVLGNLDVTIIAQAPKMAPHIEAIRQCLSADLQTDIDNINVKATTTENLGFTGRKEGIAVEAVVLMKSQ
ncbi:MULTISPECIES: 2-C-methyl-D-erythritol 2,4-cyclodiphosphate synthase [Shewanella]|jgi:2-C-methyl-D-erythritol 2,4-cyclodiphosphate synthase|uniref:2-C-methyl-D-erythritol 2,4-cyclodiphosphate synthase n=1 Tax=Shewanella frigidimarina (strain NCIMB 400) TaxID=318167 RepID=ISPF_SHEFN|nr:MULTISPECIES: 2-C-methyl-D-erythritol 2,4-cyclodiphosphate synthase [Shewanella]Q086A7.1 RecName: Full=2-C-methyl-D-erythritol 2,4-cyclodiphosphate synthase; Short=MECDP-synthase; Short=MECPP-synthase; Short=MECPS [Shewanella frigidimarina NCIMB 400]ABI70908.1 2-C-methyl-D-erythritol 2,4-cyclodiphosphate synthase [Shewanella frigidimarina NCIMB 400]MBB1425577.1 2-C-methyl-D-erythritol 2,4-cyclodiphosphate synthase [Shewanella sp. SG44-2]PKI07591.1 2-C-methyl-D-erythritol 2,4-cyclodiphosphate|tara:strand:- start:1684 stop:2163 length:480 start_codon:yes stop_codon:yes gene_type:complete